MNECGCDNKPCPHELVAGLPMKADQAEALRRYQAGEMLNFSTDIEGWLTYGYGHLDEWGFWEYPLRYNHLRPEHKKLVDECDAKRRAGE
jgi:hypothetical protein